MRIAIHTKSVGRQSVKKNVARACVMYLPATKTYSIEGRQITASGKLVDFTTISYTEPIFYETFTE